MDVGGYRLHVTERGQGGSTVVILHGAGESSYSWRPVQQQLSEFARVVAYDRPGLGASEQGPAPDAVGSVQELHTLLQTLGIPGPYILVGHSLGGLLARLYALRYPEEVAGLVFVDSTHEALKDDRKFRQGFAAIGAFLKVYGAMSKVGLPRLMGQVFGLLPMYPERLAFFKQITPDEKMAWQAAVYRNFASPGAFREFGAVYPLLEEAAQQWHRDPAIPQFGSLPMAVLTNPGFGDDWVGMHKELASRSNRSIHWISDQKGHSIQMLRPDLVINAVKHVIDEAASHTTQ